MRPGQVLGLPTDASPAALRAAALAELGLGGAASWQDIRREYRRKAAELHPDRAGVTEKARQGWARLQAALTILRPSRNATEEEAIFWREALELAEPFAAGVVEEAGDLLNRWAQRLRIAGRQPGTPVDQPPSLLRTVAADAAQAAVSSGQKAVLSRLSQYFARMRHEKP